MYLWVGAAHPRWTSLASLPLGKGQVAWFDPSMTRTSLDRLALEADLLRQPALRRVA